MLRDSRLNKGSSDFSLDCLWAQSNKGCKNQQNQDKMMHGKSSPSEHIELNIQ